MPSRPRRRLLALGILALAGGLAVQSAAQPRVRVRSEARIELRSERQGPGVAIHGYLRDDLGEPLADRAIAVRVDPSGSEDPHRRTVHTDARGAFRARFPLEGGRHRVSAEFAGDRTHDRTEVGRSLDLSRADVRLQLQVPEGGRLDLTRREHEITVWAASPEGGDDLRIELRDELDRRLGTATTDSTGRARFEVPTEALGTPGAGRLKARTPGDDRRNPAQTEVPVVRERPTHLTLEAEGHREGGAVLRGRLDDGEGPLPRRAVGLFAEGDRHLATVLTDDGGRFVHRLGADRVGEAPLVVRARFQSGSGGRRSSASAPVTIPGRPPARAPWPWLLLPMGITALALFWLTRARAPQPEPAEEASRPRPAGVELGETAGRASRHHDVGAVVRDSRDGRPVSGAMVTLSPARGAPRPIAVDPTGGFRARELSEGSWTLRVEADGYAPVEAELTLPHRGEWSRATVRMDSYRALVLRPFRRVAERWLPALRQWSTWTNREVVRRARAQGAGPGFEGLASEVERAYYGPVEPSRDDVHAIEQKARALDGPGPAARDEGENGVRVASTAVDGDSRGSL